LLRLFVSVFKNMKLRGNGKDFSIATINLLLLYISCCIFTYFLYIPHILLVVSEIFYSERKGLSSLSVLVKYKQYKKRPIIVIIVASINVSWNSTFQPRHSTSFSFASSINNTRKFTEDFQIKLPKRKSPKREKKD